MGATTFWSAHGKPGCVTLIQVLHGGIIYMSYLEWTNDAQQCMFWAKVSRRSKEEVATCSDSSFRCLPLAAHCLDVALVFRALCDVNAIRRTLSRAHGGAPLSNDTLDRLAFLAGLHDLGKANLGFQQKVFNPKAPRAGHVREVAPLLDFLVVDDDLHRKFMQALPRGFDMWFGGNDTVAYSYLLATLSHHGRPLKFRGETSGTYWMARQHWWQPQGTWDPFAAIADIVAWLTAAFPVVQNPTGAFLPEEPAFHHRFAGLVTLADWIGSHEGWFPIARVELAERLHQDRAIIPMVLQTVGLEVSPLRSLLGTGLQDFHARFGRAPWAAQAFIDALDPKDANSSLIILESETGSGKTEAALNWFFKVFVAREVDAIYFALPTRVAAYELYHRVVAALERWFPNPDLRPVTVLAVPRYAPKTSSEDASLPLGEALRNRWQDDDALERRDREWAAERPKRFLAATVAVGTIDQALLSTVQTAHAHLRSVCLDRSLLVVDEVHASDLYMSRLLENLLDHHLKVGGRAMLLSATLGARARHRYIASIPRKSTPVPDLEAAEATPYPAITLADGTVYGVSSSREHPKCVRFDCFPAVFQPDEMADELIAALKVGARVLVVMNTVGRANALLRTLERRGDVDARWLFNCRGVICPHHGRFCPSDRLLLDEHVSRRFGPSGTAEPVLLIGTQTLEQSLDIDADFLVTDLAPADVLLQRVGRLHRHNRPRPRGYEMPRCLVLAPDHDLEEALDVRGSVRTAFQRLGYGSVYDDLRPLELTRRLLREAPDVVLPQDNRRLVENTTHPDALSRLNSQLWTRHGHLIEGGELALAIAAGNAVALYDEYFGGDDAFAEGAKVAIRLGADSLHLPLSRPIRTAFGEVMDEVVIPGHLAPSRPDELVTVEDVGDGVAILRCGTRQYKYSRYGLEESL